MEHFIPLRRADMIDLCAYDLTAHSTSSESAPHAPGVTQATAFRDVAKILTAVFHFEAHERLETLKDAYAPVNPDRDTLTIATPTAQQLAQSDAEFVRTLDEIIRAANFTAITSQDLHEALQEQSLLKIRLSVDFDAFDEVLFYRRGESLREADVKTWWGLSSRVIRFTNYDRVVVFVRFRNPPDAVDAPAGVPAWTRGAVMLKLFQNVPKADLEMLFPNPEVRLTGTDKLVIGVPAVVSGLIVATTKLGATLLLLGALASFWLGLSEQPVVLDQTALLALGGGLGALAGFFWKQF
jgi:hypothetical protein